ncbi:hypothetical protein [Variovorax atrisoli]|uniref:hypothetical protein n=1 Tax=Variovorax atrisoli TaxID=3394203 RepID=UPI0033951576
MTRARISRKLPALCLAGLALAGSGALAESQYGSGTGTITAQARVNLSVTVPKLILLRVGSTNTTVDTVTWASTLSIPPVPTTPVTGNNTNVDWNGAAPTVTPASTTNTLNVYAWTNAGASGTWAYTLGGTPAGWVAGTYTNTVTYTAQGI